MPATTGLTGIAAEPIERKKLSDQVLDRLLNLFHEGSIKPGDVLPSERELMSRFAVGRPSVREAMQALSTMGLIEIRHGERARALPMTAATMLHSIDLPMRFLLTSSSGSLDHLKEARQFFEVGMVRIAATQADATELKQLQELLDQQQANLHNHEVYLEADIAFHQTIATISRNPIFASVSTAMLSWLREYHIDLVSVPGASAVSVNEHEMIYKAIAAHNPDQAERALVRHLKRSSNLYRSFLEN